MARGPRISRKKQPTLLDNEEDDEEEGDEWISDLKRFLGQQLVKYLTNKKLKAEDEELLRDIVQKYKEKLDNHVYIKHTNAQAWGKVIEQFDKATQAQQTDFAPDSEVEGLPKKRKKSVKPKKRPPAFTGVPIPKSPARTRVINKVSEWVRSMGIKAKSKYITRIDAILGDRLRPEDWNAQGSKTSDIANEVITEFSDRYPEYIRVLNRHKKIKNPRRPPRWSEATLKKKEANKQKTEERARKKALYAEYKSLPKGWRKKDFNITHSRYASGKRKRGPRYTEEEVLAWEDQTKRDKYLSGRKQREELKGLTRPERLAYFKKLRNNWTKGDRLAWKASWKAKKAKWNKVRQPKPKDDGVEEEKESEPPRKKLKARKTQENILQDDEGTQILHR